MFLFGGLKIVLSMFSLSPAMRRELLAPASGGGVSQMGAPTFQEISMHPGPTRRMEDGDDYLRLDEADGCIVWNRFALAPETRAEPPGGFGAAAPASPMAELGDYELMWAFSGSTVHMPPEHPFRSPSYQSQAIRAPRPTPIRELLSASDPSISFFTYGAPPSAVPGVKLGMPQRDRAEKTKDFLQTSPFYQHVINKE